MAEDDAVWDLTASGSFTVKSAYQGLRNVPRISVRIHRVWKLRIQPRLKIFGRLMYYKRILTAENSRKLIDGTYPVCV